MQDEFSFDPMSFERMAELTVKLKKSVIEDSQEDFERILKQMSLEFLDQFLFSETSERIQLSPFERIVQKVFEEMPQLLLKEWTEKPEFRAKLDQIVWEHIPGIIGNLPEERRSDPNFLLALRWLGAFPGYGFLTLPLEEVLRSMAWKSGRLGPTLEQGVKAILQVDEEAYGFFVKDMENRYVYVNTAMERLLDRPKTAIEGRTDAEIYDKKDAEVLAQDFDEAIQGSLVRRARMRKIGKKNKAFLEVFVAKRDPWDRPVGIYGICREITDPATFVQLADIPDSQYPSRAMRKVLAECLLEAETDSLVLLTGETGSGKEYLARYIHEHSRRAEAAFWSINMAAIPETLFESELFGYEKGAHNIAHDPKPGQLEMALGGTLFLDEIGEVPFNLQAKLLKCLEDKEFLRLGGRKKIKIDARIIAATNKDLYREADENNFRRDLLYRINGSTIGVPSLRERLEDIPVLVRELIPELAQELSVPAPTAVTPETMEGLSRYEWPGNVRELKNVLQRAVKVARGRPVTPSMLKLGQERVSEEASEEGEGLEDRSYRPMGYERDNEIDLAREDFRSLPHEDQGYHLDIMVNRLCGGQSGAAKVVAELLKMSRKTVKNRLKLVTDKKITSGNPGLAEDRMRRKTTKYLIDTFLKQAR